MLSIDARTQSRSPLRNLAGRQSLAPVYRLYRRAKVRYLVRRFTTHIVRHQYGASRLYVSLEDPLAESWYDNDWPLLPELDQLSASRLMPGARVFDLGAHQGVIAMMLAQLAGDEGSVIAVEAECHNYDVAVRNRELNSISNLELVHAAVAAEDGAVQFAAGLNGRVLPDGSLGGSRVPTVTIDGLTDRYGSPDVVFVDVEGYEQEALRGATRCVGVGRTDFFVEVHVGHGLEELGGSATNVVESFPADRFRRLVRSAAADPVSHSFAEFDPTVDAVLDERFFSSPLRAAGERRVRGG